MLAHHLNINLPSFHITLLPQHPDDWPDYARQIFIQNGWANRMAHDRTFKTPEGLEQMIWRESGELIGDTKDFLKFIKQAYDQEYNLDDGTLADIAKENYEEVLASKQASK
ncbi:hypothetical protein SpCBS45565_g04463 [Spizellomyces sp. 'palustris']|nr:hypothetical protein SpCBS45565_g04463 [Spizellomyces sp. 'palustris']